MRHASSSCFDRWAFHANCTLMSERLCSFSVVCENTTEWDRMYQSLERWRGYARTFRQVGNLHTRLARRLTCESNEM